MMGWWDGILGAAIAATCGCCCTCVEAWRRTRARRAARSACANACSAIRSHMQLSASSSTAALLSSTTGVRSASPPSKRRRSWLPTAPRQSSARSRLSAVTRSCCGRLKPAWTKARAKARIRLGSRLGPSWTATAALSLMPMRCTDGAELFTQGALVASGIARLQDRIQDEACATDLLGDENTARAAAWPVGRSVLSVLNADTPVDVLAQRGRLRWSRARWYPCAKAAPRSM